MTAEHNYDYIIAGCGASGLSLAMHMAADPWYNTKKILLVDHEMKMKNDRTWCFWEKNDGLFESIIYHSWSALNFYGENNQIIKLDISPYQYKMIRGIDFYKHCFDVLNSRQNFDIKISKVKSIESKGKGALLSTNDEVFFGDYIFNSILFENVHESNNFHYLLQHFKGWIIQSETKVFDQKVAGFMDFRVDQSLGTTFAYLLPFDDYTALVEYTYFTEKLLEDEEYEKNLQEYVSGMLGISSFKITEKEFGVIPMTNYPFERYNGNIINIGTAGRMTKPSSGFTFKFIQKNSEFIVRALKSGLFPAQKLSFRSKMFEFYDSTLLNILRYNKLPGRYVFTKLFENCRASQVFQFLDNEGSLINDLRIMKCMPKIVFSKAGFEEIISGFRNRKRK